MASLPPPHLRTMEHSPNYQPWKITLNVLQSAVDPGHAQEIYIRSKGMKSAAHNSLRLWTKWFRLDQGIGEESAYPAIASYENEAGAIVEVLDEDTYMEAYDLVKEGPHRAAGDKINPHGFSTYYPEQLRKGDFVHVAKTKEG